MTKPITIFSSILRNAQVVPYTKYIQEKIDAQNAEAAQVAATELDGDGSSEKFQLTRDGIKQILLGLPQDADAPSMLIEGLPQDAAEQDQLAGVILLQLRAMSLQRQGLYGDIDEADRHREDAERLSAEAQKSIVGSVFEKYSAEAAKHLPQIVKANQAKFKATAAILEPWLQEIFSGDYEQFRTMLVPLFPEGIPHEDTIKYIFDAINKSENRDLKDKILGRIRDLASRELSDAPEIVSDEFEVTGSNGADEVALKWMEDSQELIVWIIGRKITLASGDLPADSDAPDSVEVKPGLFTDEEKAEIAKRLSEIPEHELQAVVAVLGEKLKGAGPVLSSLVSGLDSEGVQLLFSDKTQFVQRTLNMAGETARGKAGELPPAEVPIILLLLAGVKPTDVELLLKGPEQVQLPDVTGGSPAEFVTSLESMLEAAGQQRENNIDYCSKLVGSILETSSAEAKKIIEQLPPEEVPLLTDLLANLEPDAAKKVLEGIDAYFQMRSFSFDSPPSEETVTAVIAKLQAVGEVVDNLCDTATSNHQTAEKLKTVLEFLSDNPSIQKHLTKLGYRLERIDSNANVETSQGPVESTSEPPKKTGHRVIPKQIADKLLPFLDKPIVASGLRSVGINVDELKAMLSGKEAVAADSDTSANESDSGGSKKTGIIAGLVGAVVGLLGLATSEEKGKGLLSGIGAFGLAGTAVSAFKGSNNQTEGNKGWLDGNGKWITGIGGGALALVPFLMTENKFKGSLLPIGLGIIGGALAWFFEPIRALFGLPSANSNQSDKQLNENPGKPNNGPPEATT